MPGWWNGRHAGLKILWPLRLCGFKSRSGYKFKALFMRAFYFYFIFYTYILKSKIDGSFYKGQTDYLENRLKQHNSGKSEYTSKKAPWVIVYHEEFQTRDKAIKREKYFKSAAGRKFLKGLNL
jgi:putative endonuclease